MNLASHAECGQALLTEEYNRQQREIKEKSEKERLLEAATRENRRLYNELDMTKDELRGYKRSAEDRIRCTASNYGLIQSPFMY